MGEQASGMLNTKDGMTIASMSQVGRSLMRDKESVKNLTLITDGHNPVAMLVPYEIWFQVQHFVHRVIERC